MVVGHDASGFDHQRGFATVADKKIARTVPLRACPGNRRAARRTDIGTNDTLVVGHDATGFDHQRTVTGVTHVQKPAGELTAGASGREAAVEANTDLVADFQRHV